jgi:hypothetical protein
MPYDSICGLSYANVKMAVFALVLSCAGVANGQETLVYSFEPDLEGFGSNPAGVMTLSQETSGLGATHGSNSMKVVHARFNGFAGAITMNVPEAFPNHPDDPGIDFVRYDLTLTSRFSPPDAVPGTDPTFADMSVTFFGTLPGNPEPEAQIQFLLAQAEVGDLEAGTHTIEIDLRNDGGDGGAGGGMNPLTGIIKGYDAWIDAGFVPLEFQIYSNKSVSGTDPDFEWTFYIDNVRVGQDVAGVAGDYNGNGVVDGADYVVWRNGGPLLNEVADVGTVSPADYTEWRSRFGNTSGSGLGSGAVPEPTGYVLWLVAANCWALATRWRRPVEENFVIGR